MSLEPARVDEVLRQIESAFAGVRFPGNDRLLHPECIDDMDIEAFYGGVRWQEIEERLIARENAALCFASAEGFQYLLPAYMTWTLKHFEDGDASVDHTVYSLNPGGPGDQLYGFQVSKFALLTPPQREAVVAFLDLAAGDENLGPDATAALNRYWRTVDRLG